MVDLITKYKYHDTSRVANNVYQKKGRPFSIKAALRELEENFHFDFIKFYKFGISRGRDWQYMKWEDYQKLIPKKKKKFINPKKRKYYVNQ